MRLELSSSFTNQEIESQRVATFPKASLLVRGRWIQSACSSVLLGQVNVMVYPGGKEGETRNVSLYPGMETEGRVHGSSRFYFLRTSMKKSWCWASYMPISPACMKNKDRHPDSLSSPTPLWRACARMGIWSGAGAKAPRPRAAHRRVSPEILIEPSCTLGSHSSVHSGQLAYDLEPLFQKNGNKEPR